MSKRKLTPSLFGCDTWLEVYEDLKKNNLGDIEKIAYTWPAEENLPAMNVKVCEIKSRAFDEIYYKLPGPEAVAVVRDLLELEVSLTSTERATLENFVKKYPLQTV